MIDVLLLGYSPLRAILSRSLESAGKSQLVSGTTRDLVEMGFWTLRFIEGFEKQYEKSPLNTQRNNNQVTGNVIKKASAERTSNGVGKLFSSNARTYIKLMRYVSKFLGTADKFQKKIRPKK